MRKGMMPKLVAALAVVAAALVVALPAGAKTTKSFLFHDGDVVGTVVVPAPVAPGTGLDPLYSVSNGVEERFLSEDVPVGLVLLESLARQFGVETPMIDATITLASTLNEADFRASGRTAARLGLAGMSAHELRDFLAEGV